jgi:glycosyltransferase involved in cell wall biosynthesis
VGTRPALNLLVADAAGRHLVAVGEEHMHLHKHNASILAAIKRRYGALDAAVTLTDGDRAAYVRLLGRATRIESIPNAVAPIGGGNAPLTAHTVLAVGRMSSQKGFDRLIRAFALIADEQPDWNLRICGGRGHAQERLERLIATKGLQDRVKLAGRTRQVGNELARASIYALSSRFEGLPMVMIEAMSKGVPVVAFDCPTGPRDVIRNGVNGILVPDGDEAALARAMLELMRDEDERRRLGAAGAERALDYSLGEIGPRWDALIQDLVRA